MVPQHIHRKRGGFLSCANGAWYISACCYIFDSKTLWKATPLGVFALSGLNTESAGSSYSGGVITASVILMNSSFLSIATSAPRTLSAT